jgi:hypothetical protein
MKVKHLSSTVVAAKQGSSFNNQELSLCCLQYLEQECCINVSEVFSSCTAECTEEGLDQLAVPWESGFTLVEMPHLTTSALKTGLQTVIRLGDSSLM